MAIGFGHQELNEPVMEHAGREFVCLQRDWTVGEAIGHLRQRRIGERIVYFYVVDGAGKLCGVVPARVLLVSAPEAKVAEVMAGGVISIPSTATVVDACEYFVLYRMLAFPITDPEGRIVGVVDVSLFTDEVVSLSQSEAAQNVFQLIGVHLARGRKASPWVAFRGRFPWLLCNIAGGVLCAVLAGRNEGLLGSALILALFMPVVLALSESVSVQSMTITLQGLRGGVDWRATLRALRQELLTSLLLGLACGGAVAGAAWAWKQQGAAALAIGASICVSVVTACLLGVLLPTVVRAARGNPRIAAGPVVLALADLLTLLFYFSLAGRLLR